MGSSERVCVSHGLPHPIEHERSEPLTSLRLATKVSPDHPQSDQASRKKLDFHEMPLGVRRSSLRAW